MLTGLNPQPAVERAMTEKAFEIGVWDLSELFESFEDPEIERSIDSVESLVTELESYRARLTDDIAPDSFLELLKRYEELDRLTSRVEGYAFLRFSEDTQDQQAQPFQARVRQVLAEIQNRILFITLWWKSLDQEYALRLLEVAGDYRYWLEKLRLQQPYTLTEPEEKIINLKDVNGQQAMVTLFSSITDRYIYKLEVEGEVLELNRDELSTYIWSPDADLREAAYRELNHVFGQDAPILGQIYQAIVRDWKSELVDLRSYSSPIDARNLSNDIPNEVVDTLLEVCRQNARLMQRFFKLKAKLLNMERLRRFDVYAPVAKAHAEYSYDEAARLIFESYGNFDGEVASLVRRVLNEGHVDSEARKGKRGGAFCMTVNPDLTPYVLTTFKGKTDDVTTLAHELGHAAHSLLASHHTSLTQRASMPLAETASMFGEKLLIDHLLAADPEPELKRDLLFRQLDDGYKGIIRQAFFAIYERDAHAAVADGASVDELSALYTGNLKEQFGEAVDIDEGFRHEWVSIPHFYFSPFYVYAYSFGQLLTLALYQRFRQEGDRFKPAYLDILRAGGAAPPMKILEKAGLDVRGAAFWQGGFDVLEGVLRQLESLPQPEEN
jgi:oligoendopeptidase F